VKVGHAFLQTFSTQVIQSVASIATAILVARWLGPEGQGAYAVVAAAVATGVIFVCFGQFEGNVLASGAARAPGRVLLVRSVIQAAAIALLLVVSMPWWRPRLDLPLRAAWYFVPILGLEGLALLVRGVNLGQQQFLAYNLGTLVQRFALLLAVLALRAAGRLSVETVLLGWLLAVSLNVFFAGGAVWIRERGIPVTRAAIRSGWLSAARRGLRALVTMGLTIVLVRCDIWMLGPMLGLGAVGQVSVAGALAEYLWYVPSILGNVLFAMVAGGSGSDNVARIARASRTVVALLLPVAAALMVTGRWVVPAIYGPRYAPAGVLVVILAPGMTAIAAHMVVDSYYCGHGYPLISMLSAGGALVVKAGLNLLLVPWAGLPGAVAATTLVYAALLAVKVIALGRAEHVRAADLLVPRLGDLRGGLLAARSWVGQVVGLSA
jgi:O-antigen/teichoic acid export membrane protein